MPGDIICIYVQTIFLERIDIMKENIKRIFELLAMLDEYVVETTEDELELEMYDTYYHTDLKRVPNEIQSELDELCCSTFITGSCSCPIPNREAIGAFVSEDKRFSISRGDGDSFGWLTGCIYKWDEQGRKVHYFTWG